CNLFHPFPSCVPSLQSADPVPKASLSSAESLEAAPSTCRPLPECKLPWPLQIVCCFQTATSSFSMFLPFFPRSGWRELVFRAGPPRRHQVIPASSPPRWLAPPSLLQATQFLSCPLAISERLRSDLSERGPDRSVEPQNRKRRQSDALQDV